MLTRSVFIIASCVSLSALASLAESLNGKVVSVLDGDTIAGC
jgi:hypothetical protein